MIYTEKRPPIDPYQQAVLTVACGSIIQITAHVFYEDLAAVSESFPSALHFHEKGKYFIKRAYCILTSKVAASPELNKFNVFLRQAAVDGYMYAHFE